MRTKISSLVLVAGCCAAALTAAPVPATVFPVDREFYPLYPSLLKIEPSPAPFTPPQVCGECHEEQYREWRGSMHALAFTDPVYQGELNKAVAAVGHTISRQCEGCHSPAGVLTGEISKPGLEGLSAMALAGVSCDICHSVTGTTHCQTPSREPENGSMILAPGKAAGDGYTLIKRGPSPPAEGCGEDFHQCAQSSLHQRAELCASCHQVYHYQAHFPLEATYLEWKHGPYAQRGILCQDCHMVDTETFRRTADFYRKPAAREYHHYFNGANFLLYFLATEAARKTGDIELVKTLEKAYAMAVARLQSAADLELTPIYRQGRLAEVRVRVKNIRAGHNLPTSLTNVRQMWLELTVTDDHGHTLWQAGSLAEDGALAADARLFNSDGMGDDFHFAIDPWVVTAFSRHDTIPPQGYKDVYYGMPLPQGVEKVTVRARLRYRQAEQKVAEKLLAAVPPDMDLAATYGLTKVPVLPVVDMVDKSVAVAARQPAATAAAEH